MGSVVLPSVCHECKCNIIVYDKCQGDMVCGKCGLVIVSRIIDASSEWRTFADDDRDSSSAARCSEYDNPFDFSSTEFNGGNVLNYLLALIYY